MGQFSKLPYIIFDLFAHGQLQQRKINKKVDVLAIPKSKSGGQRKELPKNTQVKSQLIKNNILPIGRQIKPVAHSEHEQGNRSQC